MKTILCYGDSNTYGTLPLDFNLLQTPFIASQHRLPREKRWTGILQNILGENYFVIEEGLNGRTTVWDDAIEGVHKNGLRYLVPCLESHAPIDLVLLMLGTNDLKAKFSISAFDIAMSVGVLVNTIQKSGCGPEGRFPEVLLMCPPPLGRLSHHSQLFSDGPEKSSAFLENYEKISKLYRCHLFDVAQVIQPSDKDGIHYDADDIPKLGQALAVVVKGILG